MKQETKLSILTFLKDFPKGVTTIEISERLHLSRSATSLYLNELHKEKLIKKQNTRPVIWQSVGSVDFDGHENKNQLTGEVFENYIGYHGSAHELIEKIKDAILYPPLGLPILLQGDSGVGKSFLAALIYRFLDEKGLVNGQFSVLNCADYANNPELLSSLLFGYVKGAFTGADEEKKGLLAETDGGLLFLDEIHRLNPENQEKLFQFMDSGTFRPIGEEKKVYCPKVRLLFATTEDPTRVFLPTFSRRISLIMRLPSFHERPLDERMALVQELFRKEGKRIEQDIYLNYHLLTQLAEAKYEGNIGSLSNQIRMLCAQALRTNSVENAIYVDGEVQEDFSIDNPEWLLIDADTQSQVRAKDNPDNINLVNMIQEDMDFREFKNTFLHSNFWNQMKNGYISNPFVIDYIRRIRKQNQVIINKFELTDLISDKIAYFIEENHEDISEKLIGKLLKRLQNHYARTYLFSLKLVAGIPQEFQPLSHLLFTILLVGSISEDIPYHSLLVAHGNSTASSIQNVANHLCDDYIFDAIDMPLDSSVKDVVSTVSDWLKERDTTRGVIMMVDMGSLTQIYEELKPQIKGDLLLINNITTAYALEIGHLLLTKESFQVIARKSESQFKTSVQYFTGFAQERNIILSSALGKKTLKKLKDIFIKFVQKDYAVIALNYNELREVLEKNSRDKNYLKETAVLITTSFVEESSDVRTFNLLDILDEEGVNEFQESLRNIVPDYQIDNFTKEIIHFFSKEGLIEKLTFLNPEIIVKQIEDVNYNIEQRFKIVLSPKKKFNLILHLALMVERIILGENPYPTPKELYELTLNGKTFYQNMKNLLYGLEQFYHLTISDWEIYVLFEILND